jgi:hypothetical protein
VTVPAIARTIASCRICDERDFDDVIDLGAQPLANSLRTRDVHARFLAEGGLVGVDGGAAESAAADALDALRHAQLAMLQLNREKFGDSRPATSGAFVLTGDAE